MSSKRLHETAMNIGIISIRGPEYHPNRRLAEAATERGHRMTLVHPYRIWPAIERNKPGLVEPLGKSALDVVLPRQGATVGASCLALIHHFRLLGIPVVNDIDAVRVAKNKFLTLMTLNSAGIPVPDTLFVNAPEAFGPAVTRLGGYPVVAKQASGRQGEGIRLVKTEKDLHSILRHGFDKYSGLLLQRFIPPAGRTDIRVLTIGGEMVGAMELQPKNGDFRANFHLSGDSRAIELSPHLEEIALRAAAAVGLEIAGVDLILGRDGGASVIELNYAPGFRGLEAATGLDIAGEIVNYLGETYGSLKVSQTEKETRTKNSPGSVLL